MALNNTDWLLRLPPVRVKPLVLETVSLLLVLLRLADGVHYCQAAAVLLG